MPLNFYDELVDYLNTQPPPNNAADYLYSAPQENNVADYFSPASGVSSPSPQSTSVPATSFNPVGLPNQVPGLSSSQPFTPGSPPPQNNSSRSPNVGSYRAYRPYLKVRNDAFNRGFRGSYGSYNPAFSNPNAGASGAGLRLGGVTTGGPLDEENKRRQQAMGGFASNY